MAIIARLISQDIPGPDPCNRDFLLAVVELRPLNKSPHPFGKRYTGKMILPTFFPSWEDSRYRLNPFRAFRFFAMIWDEPNSISFFQSHQNKLFYWICHFYPFLSIRDWTRVAPLSAVSPAITRSPKSNFLLFAQTRKAEIGGKTRTCETTNTNTVPNWLK